VCVYVIDRRCGLQTPEMMFIPVYVWCDMTHSYIYEWVTSQYRHGFKKSFFWKGGKERSQKKTSTIRKKWQNIRFLHAIFPPSWAEIARILGRVCMWLIDGTHINESWHTWMRHRDIRDLKTDLPTQKSPRTWKRCSEFEFWGESVCKKKSPT